MPLTLKDLHRYQLLVARSKDTTPGGEAEARVAATQVADLEKEHPGIARKSERVQKVLDDPFDGLFEGGAPRAERPRAPQRPDMGDALARILERVGEKGAVALEQRAEQALDEILGGGSTSTWTPEPGQSSVVRRPAPDKGVCVEVRAYARDMRSERARDQLCDALDDALRKAGR